MSAKPFVRKAHAHPFWYIHVDGCYPMRDYYLTQQEAFRNAERMVRRHR